MNKRISRAWRAMVFGLGLACAGLADANTVSVTADPLPSQTLTLTTTASSTTTENRVHPRGTVLRLQAAPTAGHQFVGWGGACSGTAPGCVVTLSGDRSVTARFFPVLTVATSGAGQVVATSGGITCGADCTEPYPFGFNVALSARPDAGQIFVGWGGACSGNAPACTVAMNGPRNVTARFAPATVSQFMLSVAVAGSGSVASTPAGISCGTDCTEPYANGTSVTLTATPVAGQVFSGWGGACSGTAPSCSVSMNQLRNVTAGFTAVVATGPTYYFSDCQAGAVAGCVPGNNANAGTSPAAPRQNLSGFDVNSLPAGSRLLFARGGVWTGFNLQLRNLNVTAAAPLVIDAYGSGPAPWLKAGGMFYAFQFGMFGDTANDGGYTLRNLKLDGVGAAGAWGVHLRHDVHHLLLENLEITGFELAVHSGSSGTAGNNFVLRNSNIHHNSEMGLLGDGYDVVIEGNTFADNNFSGSAFNHAIYLSGQGRNGIVRNNTFTNNSRVNGVCTGGNFTVHGQWDGLLVEGNTIQQDASAGGCYGISINSSYDTPEWFRNLVVRGNRIINLGNCSICLTSAPGAIVENNLIVNTQASYHAAILIPDRTPGPGDDVDTGAVVRNNTIVLTRPSAWSEAIALRQGSGTGLQVVSNLIYFGAGADPTHRCYNVGALSSFAAFDNNLCFHAAGSGAWGNVYGTLAAARAAGFDLNGLAVDPLFLALPEQASGWNEQIQLASPAAGHGHPMRSSARDRLGVVRTVPSIGSREPAR